ncbi:MAG: hypothetical protein M1818_007587 [Claussenomyces sp. TS43310]|nr:MAG: hypothetical protein M1818_007587 [Claussenomyces sp. TS43310]
MDDLSFDAPEVVEMPSTPQPHHATLPSGIPEGMSPTTSTLVAGPSSPTQAFGAQLPSCDDMDQIRFTSPPPLPSSSMTPPPSSQQPVKRQGPASPLLRAVTPTMSTLSSPPLTHVNGVKRESSPEVPYSIPTPQQIAEASSANVREMLQASIAENSRLEIKLSEARMLAAHHKLQHNLLTIETEVAAKRMEVEHEMTRREVDILQMAEQSRQARHQGSPVHADNSRYNTELKAYCEAMHGENKVLHKRLRKAKQMLAEKEEDLMLIAEENRNFLKRIRENREHLNMLKSPGGIYASLSPHGSNPSYPATPQQYIRGTPRQTPQTVHREHENSQDSFAALLMADRVLNQGSAPSTPTVSSRQPHRNHPRHNRGVQSMSSLPSTPARSRPMTDKGNLLPAVQFAPQSVPRYRSHPDLFAPTQERSRKSRDSTISASDAEDIVGYRSDDDEEIDESQASQSASAMLRRDPRESFEVVSTPTPTIAAEKSGLLQAKIFGSVTKPGNDKRKRLDDGSGSTADYEGKKARMDDEAVGLGIGAWA